MWFVVFFPIILLAIPQLSDDVVVTTSTTPTSYKYYQSNIYWAAVGVRPATGNDWDISLYEETTFVTYNAGSGYYGDTVDFVVVDYNHVTTPNWEGVRVTRYTGTGSATVEYEDNTESLSLPGTNSNVWTAGDVVECYDVYIPAGCSTKFTLNRTSGSASLGMALFKSNDAGYWAGRSSYQKICYGTGMYFYYTSPSDDWYGLVVWSRDANSGNYNVQIDTFPHPPPPSRWNRAIKIYDDSPITISTDTVVKWGQSQFYWNVVGLRSSSDWDIETYDKPFANWRAGSLGTGAVDFCVSDCNENPLDSMGAIVSLWSGTYSTVVEYEDGADMLSIGTNNLTWSAGHVVHAYDLYLSAGWSGQFTLTVTSGSADLSMALFNSNGDIYYVGRSDAVAEGTSFSFTAPNSDFYGLIVFSNNSSSANYTIQIGDRWSCAIWLTSGVPQTWSQDTIFKFVQNTYYWATVGLRSASGSDWDPYLYSPKFTTLRTYSYLSAFDFVDGDWNHNNYPDSCGVEVAWYSGSGSYTVEYEDGSDMLTGGHAVNGTFTWTAGDVIKVWDVYLSPSSYYYFNLDILSGSADLGIALLKSNGATYYGNRSDAVAEADYYGSGGDESFTYSVPSTDYYGLVVWSNNSSSATYKIAIQWHSSNINEPNSPTLIPLKFELKQVSPNPFLQTATIAYNLSKRTNVSLEMLDAYGRAVKALENCDKDAGYYNMMWDGKNSLNQEVPAGIYFCRLKTDENTAIQKIIKLK